MSTLVVQKMRYSSIKHKLTLVTGHVVTNKRNSKNVIIINVICASFSSFFVVIFVFRYVSELLFRGVQHLENHKNRMESSLIWIRTFYNCHGNARQVRIRAQRPTRDALRAFALHTRPCIPHIALFRSLNRCSFPRWRSEARTWSCAFLSSMRVKLWGVFQKGESFLWLRSRSLMGSDARAETPLQPRSSWFLSVNETTPRRAADPLLRV